MFAILGSGAELLISFFELFEGDGVIPVGDDGGPAG